MASPAAERYLATFSPEDQAAIRSGGDVDEWYNAAVSAGAVPGASAGVGGGGPSWAGFQTTTSGGKNWWDTSANELGYQSWDQGAKKMSQQFTSEQLAAMTPEQRARLSMEYIDDLKRGEPGESNEKSWQQWVVWQKHFDPNCPPDFPYQAEDGSGCVEKPSNSNRGYEEGERGGGGSGAGGAGGASSVGTVSNAGANDLQRQLEAQYAARGGIFSPANTPGIRLNEGGLLWTDKPATAPTPPAPTPPATPPTPPANQGSQPAMVAPPAGNTALINATLNAFTPNAPSGGVPASQPAQTAASTVPQTYNQPNANLVNTVTNQYSGGFRGQKPNVARREKPWWQTA